MKAKTRRAVMAAAILAVLSATVPGYAETGIQGPVYNYGSTWSTTPPSAATKTLTVQSDHVADGNGGNFEVDLYAKNLYGWAKVGTNAHVYTACCGASTRSYGPYWQRVTFKATSGPFRIRVRWSGWSEARSSDALYEQNFYGKFGKFGSSTQTICFSRGAGGGYAKGKYGPAGAKCTNNFVS